MKIRKATINDLDDILKIYEYARSFMANNDNPTQWGGGYPKKELLISDIEKGQLYVFDTGNELVGVFAFIIGEDPTYKVIENGSWNYDEAYGTIHRIATNGKAKGLSKLCFDYCIDKIPYLRIDTHHDNKPMQQAVKKYGFKECGIIYVADGSPRIAYDYHKA